MGQVALENRRTLRRRRRSAIDNAVLRIHHRAFRQGLWRYLLSGDLATMATAPVIYSLIIPFVLLDVWVSAYQAVCFRAWGIARVRRRAYFAVDRHKLAYLNLLEKFNCFYCTYANGVIAYVREVAGRTEQYWCPIRHARRIRNPHLHYADFTEYGDAEGYRRRLAPLRNQLKP